MTFENGPVAARLRKPSWRDPRLAIGVLLVLASIVLGTWLVTSAQRTTAVYAAAGALVPGQTLDAADLKVVEVRLDTAQSLYLAADADLSDLVVQRVVGAGELVPVDALASESALGVRSLGIQVDGSLSAAVTAGALVDVWFTPEDGQPAQLGAGLVVAAVDTGGSGLGGVSKPVVQVLVPLDLMATFLAALAGDGSVQVVPVP